MGMMKINIVCRGMESTDALTAYVDKKMSHLERFLDKSDSVIAHVIIGKTTHHHKEGDVYLAEMELRLPGVNLFDKVTGEDLYAAIDELKDSMEREIVKNKDKKSDLGKDGGRELKQKIHENVE